MRRALGRFSGPILILVGIVALTQHEHRLERADALAVVYVLCTAAGLALWLHRYTVLRWLAASLPFWSLANAAGWSMFLALTLSIGSLAVLAVGPTLPGRRMRRGVQPLPHLVNGPVAAINSAAYSGGRRSRGLALAAWVGVGLTVIFITIASLASFAASRAVTVALAISCAIIAGTRQASYRRTRTALAHAVPGTDDSVEPRGWPHDQSGIPAGLRDAAALFRGVLPVTGVCVSQHDARRGRAERVHRSRARDEMA